MQPLSAWLAEHIAGVIAEAPDLSSADAAYLRGWLPPVSVPPAAVAA
jgi:hypothetical protein